MRRREFIAGLGGVAVVPLAARAQSRLSHIIVRFTPKSGHGPEHARCPLKCQKSRSIAVAAGITIARADSSRVLAIVRYRSLSYPGPR